MTLKESFRKNIDRYHLFTTGDRLLLAVSGGIDSVVLCELCRQNDFNFIIAHCNFQLRAAESERDETFVRSLGEKYGVEVLVKKFDTENHAVTHKLSIQVAARQLRYKWFEELIKNEKKADYLLTAHHADDNAETVTMNFFRGTGLHGLTGIPRSAGIIRRPLLDCSKNELVRFANENKLEHVEDSSNESSKYTRNLFRNEILPLIVKAYPQAKGNLQDNIRRFREIEQLYRLATDQLKKDLCRKKGEEVHIPIRQLMAYQNKALVYEIISGYGFTEKQVEEVLKLADSESGRFVQSTTGYRIIRHRHWFIITPPITTETSMIVIEEKDTKVQFEAGNLAFETKASDKAVPDGSKHIALLDASHIEFPLILRKWKQGDYFYPLGMKKKKKLARFFIDQKLSRPDKEKVWVLEMNKKIAWVVGMRIDERYKVGEKTATVMKITFNGQFPA